jgi:hypothetical protein
MEELAMLAARDQMARRIAAEHDPAATPQSWPAFFTSPRTWHEMHSWVKDMWWNEVEKEIATRVLRDLQWAAEQLYLPQQEEEEAHPPQQEHRPATRRP